jgi:eukaryotic-like serine/threonine-protein kinase
MVVYTQTPGWRGQIWASNSPPDPDVFDTGPGGWVQLAQIPSMQNPQKIALNPGSAGYRYYLVWITSLPPGRDYAALNEIALYGLSR